jgi:hypothetical protein
METRIGSRHMNALGCINGHPRKVAQWKRDCCKRKLNKEKTNKRSQSFNTRKPTNEESRYSDVGLSSLFDSKDLLHLHGPRKISCSPIPPTILPCKAPSMFLAQLRASCNNPTSKIPDQENDIRIIGCRCWSIKGIELSSRHILHIKNSILSGTKNKVSTLRISDADCRSSGAPREPGQRSTESGQGEEQREPPGRIISTLVSNSRVLRSGLYSPPVRTHILITPETGPSGRNTLKGLSRDQTCGV